MLWHAFPQKQRQNRVEIYWRMTWNAFITSKRTSASTSNIHGMGQQTLAHSKLEENFKAK
jgi:hypothetical protein